jgi:2-succinyl-6-hydroxy-2,4-cyclohexadiene-1-carboxylate synthase
VIELFCIHGNFQTPSVWKPFRGKLKTRNSNLDVIPVNLDNYSSVGFDRWVEDFCDAVEIQSGQKKSLILGYSLGGRLALHACLHPDPIFGGEPWWSGADPGSESEEEKRLQLDRDRKWAERLKREPLEKLAEEWDAQAVFLRTRKCSPAELR